MPRREEIVKRFKEAAKREAKHLDHYGPLGYGIATEECSRTEQLFRRYAAQVAAMRCETCQLYEPETDETDDECLHPKMLVRCQGKDFGCFAHEQKPAG